MTPWTAAIQASLSFTISWNLPKQKIQVEKLNKFKTKQMLIKVVDDTSEEFLRETTIFRVVLPG